MSEKTTAENKKPTHRACISTNGKNGKKDIWHRVGSGWEHADGKGINIAITPGMSISGKIVLFKIEDAPVINTNDADDE